MISRHRERLWSRSARGFGVTKVFRSLGARVVGGGQTNNPSVQDIADAVRSVGAVDVIVIPNNKNIIMAAERVGEPSAPKSGLQVLPTRTLGQGGAGGGRCFSTRAATWTDSLTEMRTAAGARLHFGGDDGEPHRYGRGRCSQ